MGQQNGHDKERNSQASNYQVKDTLKQEISHLQEQLHDQFVIRRALEKALSFRPLSYDIAVEKSIPKAAKELIKEISVLELEVVYLEKYLLSLYRKTLDPRISSLSTMEEIPKSTSPEHKGMVSEVPGQDITSEKENSSILSSGLMSSSTGHSFREYDDISGSRKLLDFGIHRSHSSLSHHSARAVRKATDSFHSLPLSMVRQADMDASNEHFETSIPDRVMGMPNSLSEEMIKCISAVYCELADPPLINHDYLSSPISYSSDLISSQGQGDIGSQESGRFSSFNSHCDNSFSIVKSMELGGPYCTMAKVQWICQDSKKLRNIEHKVQHYKSLVYQLEEVDVRRMENEEKLAFWINVHNSLVMHAFLVHGVPKNNLKRVSLLLKAAYNVGGQIINIDMIQSSILGCRLPRPGQWLRFLFPSKTKVKVGDPRKAYAIEQPEPLLYFALCSGSFSDPAVRMYTSKKVFQQLEVAKEDYIQSNFSFNKEKKILMPKIMEYFAKDSDICQAVLVQMVEEFMPQSLRKNIQQSCHRKRGKSIEWIPHNFAFQYLLSRDLVGDLLLY
ncbi:hypothetical protein SLE2022_145750 [Rubroshorea leprosula]